MAARALGLFLRFNLCRVCWQVPVSVAWLVAARLRLRLLLLLGLELEMLVWLALLVLSPLWKVRMQRLVHIKQSLMKP
jgi:hypothetical protein